MPLAEVLHDLICLPCKDVRVFLRLLFGLGDCDPIGVRASGRAEILQHVMDLLRKGVWDVLWLHLGLGGRDSMGLRSSRRVCF